MKKQWLNRLDWMSKARDCDVKNTISSNKYLVSIHIKWLYHATMSRDNVPVRRLLWVVSPAVTSIPTVYLRCGKQFKTQYFNMYKIIRIN